MNSELTGPVPAHEIAIGRNLRMWRYSLGKKVTLPQIAEAIGEKRERLASYEHGRNPMPWSVAKALWEKLQVSPRFLATGKGAFFHPFPLLKSLIPNADPKARFSAVYAAHLASGFDAQDKSEFASGLASLDRFLKDARAGKVAPSAVLAVARTAHEQHDFPAVVVITSGPSGALTRDQKNALKAKTSEPSK